MAADTRGTPPFVALLVGVFLLVLGSFVLRDAIDASQAADGAYETGPSTAQPIVGALILLAGALMAQVAIIAMGVEMALRRFGVTLNR